MRSVRRAAIALVLGLALVGAAACGSNDADPSTTATPALGPTDCASFVRISADRAAHDVGTGERVVVIGDSYSLGYGLPDLDDSWPSRLPGRVHVAGFSGSGFAEHDSGCGAVSFADRAPAAIADGADLVVVQGGLNDTRQRDSSITQGFERLLHELPGVDVVVVGPLHTPPRLDETAHVDRLLSRLCAARHRVHYVSMIHLDVSYLSDDLHPTQAGHDAFGDRVAAAVRALPAR